jgi:uncharacterized protein YqeY
MIYEKLKEDLLAARKEAKVRERNLLSTVVGDLQSNAKLVEGNKVVTEEETVSLIKKYIKNLNEMINLSDNDAVKYEAGVEVKILEKYLPSQLSDKDIQKIINSECSGMDKLKDIMTHFKTNYNGLYDGKILSKLVKEHIG